MHSLCPGNGGREMRMVRNNHFQVLAGEFREIPCYGLQPGAWKLPRGKVALPPDCPFELVKVLFELVLTKLQISQEDRPIEGHLSGQGGLDAELTFPSIGSSAGSPDHAGHCVNSTETRLNVGASFGMPVKDDLSDLNSVYSTICRGVRRPEAVAISFGL